MCSYCNDVVDYIEHFFFDCPTIKKFWNYIEQYILIIFDIQTHLTVVDVLFGIKRHNCGKVKTKRINHIILIAKMCISMHKKPNAFPPLKTKIVYTVTKGKRDSGGCTCEKGHTKTRE